MAEANDPSPLMNALLALTDLDDLAQLLEVSTKHLRIVLWGEGASRYYCHWEIKKKSGGNRLISAPQGSLLRLQQKLLPYLSDLYVARISTHGYVPGKSIVSNAKVHVRQRYVFNVDLVDFFPSINFGRVRGLFMATPFRLPADVATAIAQLATLDGGLPVGAPTSPVISNMICLRLDVRLQRLARQNRCLYTRYADDLTFSTAAGEFPKPVGYVDGFGQAQTGDELQRLINDNGFEVNEEKTRLLTPSHRQEVTGIVVNKRLNVRRRFSRQVRSMLFNWEQHGEEFCQDQFESRYLVDRYPGAEPRFRDVVRGKIAHIGAVRGTDDALYISLRSRFEALANPDRPYIPASTSSTLHTRPIQKLFICYSRQDIDVLEALLVRLRPAAKTAGVELLWDANGVSPGDEWDKKIRGFVDDCDMALLLISAHFFDSAYVQEVELPVLLNRAENQLDFRVLNFIIAASRYGGEPRLNRYQALNDPARPLNKVPPAEREEHLQDAVNLVEGLLVEGA